MSPANFRPPGLTVFSLSEDAEVAANKLLKSDVGGWQLWEHRVHDETSMLQLIHNLVLRRHFGDPEVDELTQFVRANSDSLSGVLKILEGAAETFCKAGHTDQAKHLRNM